VGVSLLLLALDEAWASRIASCGTHHTGVPLRSTHTHVVALPTLNLTSVYYIHAGHDVVLCGEQCKKPYFEEVFRPKYFFLPVVRGPTMGIRQKRRDGWRRSYDGHDRLTN
jgi:hypothetical protein